MLNAFIADFLYAVVALFVIIDPVGTAIIFAALTTHDDAAKRRTIAKRAALISFLVLLVFGLAGEKLLRLLGIGIPALQIAGGALLFLSAKDMVTAKGELRASREERSAASESTEDISVFPLAIPLIAGPGGMTTMVLLHAKAGGQPGAVLANALALAAMIVATLVSMLGARRLARLMGTTGASVIGRVLGILVAALAAQFIIEGTQAALHLG
ncbi:MULTISPECIES: MarC family protein [unclassified Acidiphilium]|jgi:multiple antibiotic resistance protein|uniref:MarC family protein n=1 Tax=unclassified Acidiphilium TaxID=2617493 RepID=UPI000BCB4EA5|nr:MULTISPECIES: MarC family protein [unclassified Acidiphilium]OYV54843.1 MAG: antibiotic resistance protein MarC [Acidiphilium sp. 20-67-58]HQT62324.1 MarC family protein [Acidiphilium sp.]